MTGFSAFQSVPWGTFISKIIMVMMMASTPSLNASSRFLLIRINWYNGFLIQQRHKNSRICWDFARFSEILFQKIPFDQDQRLRKFYLRVSGNVAILKNCTWAISYSTDDWWIAGWNSQPHFHFQAKVLCLTTIIDMLVGNKIKRSQIAMPLI